MNWFRKSSSESRVNQPSAGPHAVDANVLSKSLSSLQHIELLDPEAFFDDPAHVRNYREEAQFQQLMSEWVIVPHDVTAHTDNYFSADFEDELLQLRTQRNSAMQTIETAASAQSESDGMLELPQPPPSPPPPQKSLATEDKDCCAEVGYKKRKLRLFWCRHRLYQLLFAENIQMGMMLPAKRPHVLKKGKQHKDGRLAEEMLPGSSSSIASSVCSLHAALADLVAPLPTALLALPSSPLTCPNNNNNNNNNSSSNIIKDCAINRTQLKTEALARSIMGAIGKCPDRDSSPRSSEFDLIAQTGDRCHPASWSSCDHYDIKQYFRLDDSGNILLSLNHIEEFKGFGFAVAHDKSLYRHCRKLCQLADDRKRYTQLSFCIALKRFLNWLWKLLFGHPRNKMPTHSGPGDTVRAYTLQLAQDPTSTFARNIENFISCTKESREAAPQVVMRNMRQFMNGMKNYLVKHGEGEFHQEVETARGRLKADEFLNLDAILETVMHQLVVLPLREHLYGMFVDYYKRSEDIQLLAQNVNYACGRNAADFGIRATVTPPSPTSLQIISSLLQRLQEAELPLDKLELFLCVITTIFEATGCARGQQLGADDFLPVLVYVVAKCGFVGAEIEAEFMWGLLQPTLLNGEPGYYLTALCSAVHVLKSFMASENEHGTGSLDWRSSSLPACSSVLRVIIPDECNGSLQTRTLPVRPHTTTREVCRIIAHKARITNPQDYALFKLVDGEETLLNDVECPQDVRFACKGKHCMLAYKRIDAKIAWPTATY